MALMYEVWIDPCDPPSDGTLVVLSMADDSGQKMLLDSEHFDQNARTGDDIASWVWFRIRADGGWLR